MERVFLRPGQFYFGAGQVCLETLLGPCVAILVWFPAVRRGGMCHFQLPQRRQARQGSEPLDGRYGDEAWMWLQEQMQGVGLMPVHAQIRLLGAARAISWATQKRPLDMDIAAQSAAFAEHLMSRQGLPVVARDMGGSGHRYVRFDLATGEVWVRRGGALSIGLPEVRR